MRLAGLVVGRDEHEPLGHDPCGVEQCRHDPCAVEQCRHDPCAVEQCRHAVFSKSARWPQA